MAVASHFVPVIPHNSAIPCHSYVVALGKVHHGVGRLVKVYVA